jgi:tetratricopeptide (TPR) repeat protein
MRSRFIILISLILSFQSTSQINWEKLRSLELKFYESFNKNDNYNASRYGDSLLFQINESNINLDTNIADLRIAVGIVYYDLGNFKEALEINLKSQELFSKIWLKSNSRFLLLLNRIAWNYKLIGDYNNSLKYFKELLELNIVLYGSNHLFTAATLNNLGVINNEIGNYNEAIIKLTEAYEIYKNLYGKNHEETLNCLTNIALSYRMLGEYNKSLKLNEDISDQRKLILGENHPDYILSLNNLAEIQNLLGQFNLARNNFLKSISIQEKHFGKNNNEYLQYLSNYAAFLTNIGNVDSSLILSQKCLDLCRELNGLDHPLYVNRLNNSGVSLLKMNNFSLAKIYFDSSSVLSETIFGPQHETTISCHENLASAWGEIGDYSKAAEIEIYCLIQILIRSGNKNLVYGVGFFQVG